MKNIIYILIIAMVVATGCSKEAELVDSIYVPDHDYPSLPAYSEWGYNTFGVIWEREYFIYNTSEIPLKIIKNDDKLSFLFQGHNNYEYNGGYLALRFTFSDPDINEYIDLLTYDNHIIDFKADGVMVEMLTTTSIKTLNILDGEIYFKRAQKLFIDDIEEQIILSGTFSLKFLENEIPESMTNGRFDFGVNDDIFFDLTGY